MRISADESDPGYSALAYKARVLFNGEEIQSCVTADEELGEVICFVPSRGRGYELDGRGGLKRQTRHGEVKIIMEEEK